jgi:PEP-CTERM motif
MPVDGVKRRHCGKTLHRSKPSTGRPACASSARDRYNTGIEWGWANFHISIAPALNLIQGLRNAFAFDTSSMTNFDLALDCPVDDCPLNAFVTTASLEQLDEDFLAAPLPIVPEPQTWAMALIGFAGLGLLGLRRRRIGIA